MYSLTMIVISIIITSVAAYIGNEILTSPYRYKPSGRRRRQIMGGERGSVKNFPYLVAIAYNNNELNLRESYKCAGSIINENWIVSAAHCFHGELGATKVLSWTSMPKLIGGRTHRIIQIYIHGYYNDTTLANDIAMVKVTPPFTADPEGFRPIPMFEANEEIVVNSTGLVPGYGQWGQCYNKLMTEPHLNVAQLPTLTTDECSLMFSNRSSLYIGPETVCAGYKGSAIQKSLCPGDSGSPLVIDGRLAGIASWAIRIVDGFTYPAVYTRVSKYRAWIDYYKTL